jgi:2-hydroxy-3-keto-5-methylthiopentenyl-1-phosphate phosphatase
VNLALDWDGTCTVSDSLVDAVRNFGDPRALGAAHGSYGESLAAEVGSIRAPAEEVSAWAVEHVRVRPGLHALAERFRPVIVSSGLPQLIAPVLEREGLELEVRCNGADPLPEGWRVRFRDVGPCPVCGDMCKRRSLPDGPGIVYVGDGVSDHCAALASDRVFARGWLAAELGREGIPYEPFETLDDVAAALS